MFQNIGRTTCLLRGYPRLSAVGPGRVRRVLHVRRGGTYFGMLAAADARPGASVYIDYATSSGCDGGLRRPLRFRNLVFTLPQGGRVRAPGVSVTVTCGLTMTTFGLPVRYAHQQARAGTPGALRARLLLPSRARRGAILHYVVELSNPTETVISLRPCPGYTEGLFALRAQVRRSFRLNCTAVRDVRAHTRVRYAMQLQVPAATRRGIAKLAWNMNTPTGPSTGGTVEIVA